MAENIIYYGPPGTGKTYLLQQIMNNYVDYEITDEQIRTAYIRESREWILLTMILLQNHRKMQTTEIQGIINRLNLQVTVNAAVKLEEHSIEPPAFAGIRRSLPRIFYKNLENEWYVRFSRVQQEDPEFIHKFLSESNVIRRYNFVTFHQSYSYEDFVEGIRPEYVQETQSLDYSPKPGLFKLLCNEAHDHSENEYALFIDEINRGNISEIFGELISLLEIDKREGEAGELSARLPYSRENFTVPSNINIYGTMNTADRSIDQMDIALRRRFKFVPLLPDMDAIKREMELQELDADNIDGIDLIKLVETMNARIELLLDSQHLLGHALFIHATSFDKIVETLTKVVVPLLEEYFYDDLQKIQLVFNDLDDTGELRNDAFYTHDSLTVDSYFSYTGDYMLDDKKHFHIADDIHKSTIEHIYA